MYTTSFSGSLGEDRSWEPNILTVKIGKTQPSTVKTAPPPATDSSPVVSQKCGGGLREGLCSFQEPITRSPWFLPNTPRAPLDQARFSRSVPAASNRDGWGRSAPVTQVTGGPGGGTPIYELYRYVPL